MNKPYSFACGLFVTTTISSLILVSSHTSAANGSIVSEASVTVPEACTINGTGMNTHNAEIANGTYRQDIGTTTLKAFCNDNNGFAIYAAGYTGNEIGATNSNKLVGTAASSNATIVTGTAISAGNPDISNWAMKLATVSDPTPTYPITLDNGFGSYSAVPNSYTKVAHRDSSTDIGTNAEGATLTTTYAAYISKTQPADTYSGQVIYTLVHPASEEPAQPRQATAGCINYFANASNAVGTMGCQSTIDGQTKDLLASNYSREGYGFAGWSNKYDYATSTALDLKFYGPQETITVPEGTTANGLSLYAVWVPSAGSLQDSSKVSQLCGTGTGSLTTAPIDGTANLVSVSALTDQRDNQTYAIAKLADGKCWMIENLRLADKDSSNNDINLSSANTHNPSLPITNIYDATNPTTSNHLSATTDPTTTAWCTTNSSACDDQSMIATNNTTLFTSNVSSSYSASSNVYSYGNYYNWYSATAGHGTYSKSSGNVAGDICPTGWHLPTGGNATAEFGALDVAMGGTGAYQSEDAGTAQSIKWHSYPNNFVYSGFVHGPSVLGRSSGGSYWSSSVSSSNTAYILYSYTADIGPGTSESNKYRGRMVRCVAGV